MTSDQHQPHSNIVILDRDGVINEDSPLYVKSPDECIPIPGSINAIARLSQAGFRVVIATNQSGLARKLFDESSLSDIHHKLRSMVEEFGGEISGIFYCPHAPEANCSCRKPATGLLEQIERALGSSLVNCYFIGDSEKDLKAAMAFGCNPVLVRTGNGALTERMLAASNRPQPPVYNNLADAVESIFFNPHAQ